ncbi:hypothetical protein MLC52_09780 [Sulfurimonas sp. NW15]|uniref:hypothetical protein n=1 Tax=Sulfurimonas TaxID=202746 RepID=UPI00125EA53A|nr:hypothetical protein [Sulfurimonas hydrogeniphila]
MITQWIKKISEQYNLIDSLVLRSNDFYSLNSKIKDIQKREIFIVPPADINKIANNITKLADRIPDVRKGLDVLNKTAAGAFFWEDEQEQAEFVIELIKLNILVRNISKEIGLDNAMKIQFYYVIKIFKHYLNIKKRVPLEKYANISITLMFGELKERQYKITNDILEKTCINITFRYYN